ncbi:MAG: hypothetical protein ACRDJ4_07785 [Actinomycetota bacterium]
MPGGTEGRAGGGDLEDGSPPLSAPHTVVEGQIPEKKGGEFSRDPSDIV